MALIAGGRGLRTINLMSNTDPNHPQRRDPDSDPFSKAVSGSGPAVIADMLFHFSKLKI